ncbi:CxxH/CxxC protein, BA_5709 family [Clostridium amylolyticum]|uniref:CxxH/CxxC protein, BA_5709 family n=1 Tax=Clostridium amylolyticum TaxID=1121298 RepID=A0A1M6FLU4_9CLOT|nr:CxxH/CxxC protein [Clostridium amylolyticum]SHI98708.1 CxxH/CxxC protein, BA_5709 family [Clostridium amylolyticum]
MEKQCICCCEEHLDMAFDDFLVEYEIWPELKKSEETCICSYCSSKAVYCLENSVKTE